MPQNPILIIKAPIVCLAFGMLRESRGRASCRESGLLAIRLALAFAMQNLSSSGATARLKFRLSGFRDRGLAAVVL